MLLAELLRRRQPERQPPWVQRSVGTCSELRVSSVKETIVAAPTTSAAAAAVTLTVATSAADAAGAAVAATLNNEKPRCTLLPSRRICPEQIQCKIRHPPGHVHPLGIGEATLATCIGHERYWHLLEEL